jgi:hypothetical protein
MAVLTLTPSTVGSNAVISGGGSSAGIGTSTATERFLIKAVSVRTDDWTRVDDVTGDGDSTPVMKHNGLGYARLVISGYMIKSNAIGLQNLINTSTNTSDGAVPLVFQLSADRQQTRTVMVERIRVNWRHDASYAGVSLIVRQTQTTLSAIETAVP